MADYLIKGETLSTIANGVRNVSGVNKELTPSSMAEIMSSYEGSGGGGAVETCTVTISSYYSQRAFDSLVATVVEDGVEKPYVRSRNELVCEDTIQNVKCGSIIVVILSCDTGIPYIEVTEGAALVKTDSHSNSFDGRIPIMFIFTAPVTAGVHATIIADYEP